MEKEKKNRWQHRLKIVGIVALCLMLLTGSFFAGYFVYKNKINDALDSYVWSKEEIEKHYYFDFDETEFSKVLTRSLNGQLDAYSYYMSPDEYQSAQKESSGAKTGIGIVFKTRTADKENTATVFQILANSPAMKAGIFDGDELTAYGNDEETLTPFSTYDAFKGFLETKADNETFYIKVDRDGEQKGFTLSKQDYRESKVIYRTASDGYYFDYGTDGEMKSYIGGAITGLDSDTAYIRLSGFDGNASKEFEKAMARFRSEHKKNLILDLRNNGGGYLDILGDISGYLLKNARGSSPVVAFAKYKDGTKEKFYANKNVYNDYFPSDGKITVLADHNTASASECLIGAMIDYGSIGFEDVVLSARSVFETKNGETVRTEEIKTYGKGIMQTTFTRRTGAGTEAIKLTTAKIFWPNGNSIHGKGIVLSDGARQVAENLKKDAELTSAIELVGL